MTLCIFHESVYLLLCHGAFLHLVGQLQHPAVAAAVHCVYGRQGQLALQHVVARGFAYLRRVVIVENIVPYLEYYTEMTAERACVFKLLARHSCRQHAYSGACLEQCGGLLAYHLEINLLRNLVATDVRQLQYLTVRKRASQLGKIAHDVLRMGERHVKQRRREYVVAHQHSHLIIISGIHRSLSAPLAALVHHVVVHERGRMQQLQTHRSVLSHVGHVAERLSHEQYQHRAHALSGAPSDVFERTSEHAVLVG